MMPHAPYRQRGLSLISLMIAMAIGIFLLGGVIKIYANSKVSFNTRNVVADVTEVQRFALDDMRRIVSMAGRNITGIEEESATTRSFPPIVAGGIFDGNTTTSDIIAIRYRRGPSCGTYLNIPMSQPPATVRFFVDNNNQLICELNGTPTVLATNVYYLKALYGVDTDPSATDGGGGFADKYLRAAEVEAEPIPEGSNTPWVKVVSMRIGIMVGSAGTLPPEARATAAELGPIPPVLTTTFAWPEAGPLFSRLYKVASITVAMRNLNTTIVRQSH